MSETAHMRGMAAISHYVEMRARQPLRSHGDSVHTIHAGTDYEAELKLSDLVRAVKEHDDMLTILKNIRDYYPGPIPNFVRVVNAIVDKAEGRS